MKIQITAIIFALMFTSTAMSSAFIEAGDAVTGISGVVIDGDTYDATFHNTLASADEFVYSEAFALSASNALLDLFTGSGQFQGTEPDLVTDVIVGSELDFAALITTIYEVDSNNEAFAWSFVNKGSTADPLDEVGITQSFDPTLNSPSFAFTEWTPVSTIPVPATVWLMATGLLGLIGYSRKNKAN